MSTFEMILFWLLTAYGCGCVISGLINIPMFFFDWKTALQATFLWPLEVIAIMRGAK